MLTNLKGFVALSAVATLMSGCESNSVNGYFSPTPSAGTATATTTTAGSTDPSAGASSTPSGTPSSGPITGPTSGPTGNPIGIPTGTQGINPVPSSSPSAAPSSGTGGGSTPGTNPSPTPSCSGSGTSGSGTSGSGSGSSGSGSGTSGSGSSGSGTSGSGSSGSGSSGSGSSGSGSSGSGSSGSGSSGSGTSGSGSSGSGSGSTGSSSPLNLPVYDVCSGQGAQGGGSNWPGTTVEAAPGLALNIYEVDLVNNSLSLVPVSLPPGSYDPAAEKQSVLTDGSLIIPTGVLAAGKNYTIIACTSAGQGASDPNCSLSVNPSSDPSLSQEYPGTIPLGDVIVGTVLAPFSYETGGQNLLTFSVDQSGNFTYGADGSYGGLPILLDSSNSACKHQASPLIVEVSHNTAESEIALSSPSQGVKFDIVGNGTPVQISWPLYPLRDMFLALPNADGSITSVQQLFGNNTVGPDGKKASNGFTALAKYARAGQTQIDSSNEIYSSLRLWADFNRDGKVEAGELFTLQDMGIKSISLNYRDVFVQDSYGNQSRERTDATGFDGLPRLIFDMWFELP